nr:unnamed protein product [Spirometra erinaceieuropaei]
MPSPLKTPPPSAQTTTTTTTTTTTSTTAAASAAATTTITEFEADAPHPPCLRCLSTLTSRISPLMGFEMDVAARLGTVIAAPAI